MRASRVQISGDSLIGQIFHVPDGVERLVRNDIYQGRTPERYYDALEWVFMRAGLRARFQQEKARSSWTAA